MSVDYGSAHDSEIVEAYEEAMIRLKKTYPMAAAYVEQYVEAFLGIIEDRN